MNIAVLIGELNNSEEIKMFKNLEVLEFKVNGIKCKAFGKLANEIKSMKGQVVATGEITLRDYTNKDGRTYPIQEIVIKRAKQNSVDKISSPKDIPVDDRELPFY